jgi:hypothetical protein
MVFEHCLKSEHPQKELVKKKIIHSVLNLIKVPVIEADSKVKINSGRQKINFPIGQIDTLQKYSGMFFVDRLGKFDRKRYQRWVQYCQYRYHRK